MIKELHLLFLISVLIALHALVSSCNSDVFVSDESVNSGLYTVTAGDSITVRYNMDGLETASLVFERRVEAQAFDASGQLIALREGTELYINSDLLAKAVRVEFSSGNFGATLHIDRARRNLIMSGRRNASVADDFNITLNLYYEYSTRTLEFLFIPVPTGEKLKITGIKYDYLREQDGRTETFPTYTFTNSGPIEQIFTLRPFVTFRRRVSFQLDDDFLSLDIDTADMPEVPLPSLPLGNNSGGVDFWGDSMRLVLGQSTLPSLIADREYNYNVGPMQKISVEISGVMLIISSDITFTLRHADGTEFEVPGKMWVEDDQFPKIKIYRTPLE